MLVIVTVLECKRIEVAVAASEIEVAVVFETAMLEVAT